MGKNEGKKQRKTRNLLQTRRELKKKREANPTKQKNPGNISTNSWSAEIAIEMACSCCSSNGVQTTLPKVLVFSMLLVCKKLAKGDSILVRYSIHKAPQKDDS